MTKKTYILGLKSGARIPPSEVTQRVLESIKNLEVDINHMKTTRAGCVVVEADEKLENLVKQRCPTLFIEEQQYLRQL